MRKSKQFIVDKFVDYDVFRSVFAKHIETEESALSKHTGFDTFLFGFTTSDYKFSFYQHDKERMPTINYKNYSAGIQGHMTVENGKTIFTYTILNPFFRIFQLAFMILFAVMGIYNMIQYPTNGSSSLILAVVFIVMAGLLSLLFIKNPTAKALEETLKKIVDEC